MSGRARPDRTPGDHPSDQVAIGCPQGPRSVVAGVDAIVVAAGESRRMGGADKLTSELGGRPLLAWSLQALARAPSVDRIVLVVAPARVAEFASAAWLPEQVTAIVAGGSRRHESVAAGLLALLGDEASALPAPPGRAGTSEAEDRVVLVHDGARPLVSPELIERVAAAAAEHGAAIPVVAVTETLKVVRGDLIGATVDRTALATAQTPQGARLGLLRVAFDRYPPEGPQTWTDEAALLEACSMPVHVVPGDPTNLKVTLPDDLVRAEAIVTARQADSGPVAGRLRIGYGTDRHPFGPGGPLLLGGVVFAAAPRLQGHSDGDVALHAVADALLGAACLGDLGRIFPAGPATPPGIGSDRLLADVRERLAQAGFRPTSLDVTIVAARPRLADRLEEMRSTIARLVGLDSVQVSVKASSGNLSGPEGAGRIVSATAVALVETT